MMKFASKVIVAALISSVATTDASERWIQTEVLAAPEAGQAAAADESFVYAINSTVVAKYERASGKRLATSTGSAKHLNSGFSWEGKLYCAHSNYPQKPEKSEIMVLDPESMNLTPFKEFGQHGGSLTWAVRDEEFWWCNFAYYGDANAQTTLVKFDQQWQKQGSWIYPLSILGELGRYSISGGIWKSGHLLVTGHDRKVIYSLRLPAEGNMLELEARLPPPFPGQGISIDPKTHGLIGINRDQRRIIFAAFAE